MVVRIEPTQGPGRQASPTRMLWPWKYGSGDWIVPGGQSTYEGETVPSVRDPDLVGPLQGFDASYSGTSLTVTILPGEMTLMGAYVGSDDETLTDAAGNVIHDVTLDASTANQQVYVGYDHTATDEEALIIGKSGAFTSADQPRQHIWTFDTDAGGVIAADGSPRPLGKRIDQPNVRYDANRSGVVDSAEDAQALGGRSLTTVMRDSWTVPLPQATIQDGDSAQTRIKAPGGMDTKLLGVTNLNSVENAPTGQDAVVYAGDGTELYRTNEEMQLGTPDAPVAGPWSRVYLAFYLENNTGGTIDASANFKILFE